MHTAAFIVGLLLACLSALVLSIMLRHLWRATTTLMAFGIKEPVPLDLKARMIVWAWGLAFIVGVGMIIWAYVT
jgi:hypothetical protein